MKKNDAPQGGFNIYDDEDVQLFRHYLELCDADPVRAFVAYKKHYIIPLRDRLSEIESKAQRHKSDRSSDIEHFIDFIKKLGVNEDMDYKSYSSYCQENQKAPRFGNSKFYELRSLAVKRILVEDLPTNFSLSQAKVILRNNEWFIPPDLIDEALKDQTLFVELPMSVEERIAFLGDGDNTPIYAKYQLSRKI